MILAIVQARMGSQRLPGKSMALIEGKPLVEHVTNRVKASQYVSKVVLATTENPLDDILAKHVEDLGIPVYRGSEEDVLSRFYWCAERYPDADVIVRITSDDPFKCPELIDQCIAGFLAEWAEPREGVEPPQYMHLGGLTWPIGLDVEVFTRSALTEAYKNATKPEHREHITPWMAENFGVWIMKDTQERRDIGTRWTIDDETDLLYARAVYAELYAKNPTFGYNDILEAGY